MDRCATQTELRYRFNSHIDQAKEQKHELGGAAPRQPSLKAHPKINRKLILHSRQHNLHMLRSALEWRTAPTLSAPDKSTRRSFQFKLIDSSAKRRADAISWFASR